MNKLNYIILLIAILVNFRNSIAQIPINDAGWNLQPAGTSGGTEEFNSSLDFTNKWIDQYPGGNYHYDANLVYPANLIQTITFYKTKNNV